MVNLAPQILATASAVWLALVATFWGDWILRKLDFQFESTSERLAFSLCLGFGTFGVLLAVAGLLGLFSGLLIFLLLTGMTFPIIVFSSSRFSQYVLKIFSEIQRKPVFIGLSVVAFVAVIQAWIPSTAHDALAYQLDIPKRFAHEGRIHFIPYGVNSVFPLLMNMYYVLAQLWDGSRMANLFHLLTALGIALGLIALEAKAIPEKWKGISALIFLLTPGIFNQMTIAYNDIALSFFTFFTFYAFVKWVELQDDRWFYLASIFMAFAFGVKYLAALALFVIVAYLAYKVVRKQMHISKAVSLACVMGGIVLLISGFWYLRSFFHEGSFLYFGEGGYKARAAKSLLFFLTPWQMTMDPAGFGGSWARLGFLYLAFLPGVFFFSKKPKRFLILSVLSVGYFLLWLFLPRQNLRFLFPVCTIWAVLIAHFIFISVSQQPSWFRIFLKVVLVGALLFEFFSFAYHGRSGYGVALGFESDATYLAKTERTYEVARFVNEKLPKDVKILNAYEVRMYYFDRAMVREPEFAQKTHYDLKFKTPEEAVTFLRRNGFTHVLIAGSRGSDAGYPWMNIRELVREPRIGKRYFREIYRSPSGSDPDFEYAVFELI